MIENQTIFWSGQYLFPDSDDPGTEPDVGLLEGTITFTPVWDTSAFGLLSDSVRSTFVKAFPFEVREGKLMSLDEGAWVEGVKVPASIGGHALSWVTRFDLTAGGDRVTVRELRFNSNPGGEVHLHNIIPPEAIYPQLPQDIVKGDSVTNIFAQGESVVFIVGDPPRTRQYIIPFPGTDEAIQAAIGYRDEARSARDAAVVAKNDAVTAKNDAQAARSGAQTARTGAETARTVAVTAKDDAQTARTGAETARTAASASASAAATDAGRAEAAANSFGLSVTTATGAPGTNAAVTVSGDGPAYTLGFTVPQGAKGDKGDKGDDGEVSQAMLDAAVASLVDGAPEALDTLTELATALGNDPNFATTVSTEIGKRALIDGAPAAYNTLGKLVTALQNHELGGSTDASLLTGALTDQVVLNDAVWRFEVPGNGEFEWSLDEALHQFSDTLESKSDLGHTHTKSEVGLSNVDNTSDANKPISTATQTALNGKESGHWYGTQAQYDAISTKDPATTYNILEG